MNDQSTPLPVSHAYPMQGWSVRDGVFGNYWIEAPTAFDERRTICLISTTKDETFQSETEYRSVKHKIPNAREVAELIAAAPAMLTALRQIADMHIPDQPAAIDESELAWAQRHVGTLRRIALDAIPASPVTP